MVTIIVIAAIIVLAVLVCFDKFSTDKEEK